MRYIGYFRDIKDVLYKVEVATTKGTSSKEVTLGVPPFTTKMDNSDDNIYKPVKYQGATIAMISDGTALDIYSGGARGVAVTLYRGDEIVWKGYASPSTYDQGYTLPKEELDIDCIDGLSVLKYIKYTAVDNIKKVESFKNIIDHLLTECGTYKNFYWPTCMRIPGFFTPINVDTFISEENFFDKKDDNKKTDTDVAWKANEVLEQICQYFGVVAVGNKEDVYFLDYDAIRQGNNDYWKFELGKEEYTKVTLDNTDFVVTSKEYSSANSRISLDNVYNKVVVKDKLYEFDAMIPDFFTYGVDITADDDAAVRTSQNVNIGQFGEVVKSTVGDNEIASTTNNMEVLVDRVRNPQKGGYKEYNAVFVKYLNNPYFKFHKYKWNGSRMVDITDQVKRLNYTDTKTMYGATLCKFDVQKLKLQDASAWAYLLPQVYLKNKSLDSLLAQNEISKVSFSNYLMLNNPEEHHIKNEDMLKYPYVETEAVDLPALFGYEDSYLLISGSYYFHYFTDDPYPIPESEADIREGRFAMDAGHTVIYMKLQIGDLYWSGDTTKGDNGWVKDSNTTFKVPYLLDTASAGDRRADATMFKFIEICNTVVWRIGTDDKAILSNALRIL